MSRFEFNTVLVSIVLAFAISEILTGWGRLIRIRERVESPALFLLASSWILMAIVVHWFGLWAYEPAPFDRLLETLLILVPALLIALVCFAWAPEVPPSGACDLDEHYFDSMRWTLPMIALFLFMGSVADLVVPNVEFAAPFWFMSLWSGVILALAFTRNRRAHIAGFTAFWMMYLAGIGLRL